MYSFLYSLEIRICIQSRELVVRSLPFVPYFLTNAMNLGHPVVSLLHGPPRLWRGIEKGERKPEEKGRRERRKERIKEGMQYIKLSVWLVLPRLACWRLR